MDQSKLNEEINKMIFLSKYDTSKTVVENSIINEQNPGVIAKDIKIAGQTLAKAEAEAIMAMVAKDSKSFGQFKSIDDVVAGVKNSNPKAMKLVVQNTKNPALVEALAKNLGKNTRAMENLASEATRRKKSIEGLLKEKGYSDDFIAKLKQTDSEGKYFKPTKGPVQTGSVPGKSKGTNPTKKGPTKGGNQVSPKNAKDADKLIKNSKKSAKIKELGTWSKVKAHWQKYWKWYVGIGALAAAYWYFFPDATDVEETVDVSTDDPAPSPAPGGGGVGGGSSSQFQDCPNFPLTQGCRSEMVREIQNCLKTDANGNPLRADGLFGPRTAGALTKQGYATEVTKEVYDKIKANCGGTPTPTEEPDDVNPFAGAPSLDAEE